MSTPTNPELEAVTALVESEGWRHFMAFYEQEWGTAAFGQKVARAVGDSNVDPSKAVQTLQQITVALNAVQGLKDWPANRIAYLKRKTAPVEQNMSRRGPGL